MYPGGDTHPLDKPTPRGVSAHPPRRDLVLEISTPCEQTHTCENITFSQLRLRVVKISFIFTATQSE